MALFKKITNDKGVALSYHKIMGVSVDTLDGGALSIHVGSFTSQDYRAASIHNTVDTCIVYADVTEKELETTPLFTLAYGKLKETEQFKGAEDV